MCTSGPLLSVPQSSTASLTSLLLGPDSLSMRQVSGVRSYTAVENSAVATRQPSGVNTVAKCRSATLYCSHLAVSLWCSQYLCPLQDTALPCSMQGSELYNRTPCTAVVEEQLVCRNAATSETKFAHPRLW